MHLVSYIMQIKKTAEGKIYLKCKVCRVRIVMEADGSVGVMSAHNHEADLEEVAALSFWNDLRIVATDAPEKNAKEIFNEVQLVHQEAAQTIGFHKIRNLLYSTKLKGMPPVPKCMQELADSIENHR